MSHVRVYRSLLSSGRPAVALLLALLLLVGAAALALSRAGGPSGGTAAGPGDVAPPPGAPCGAAGSGRKGPLQGVLTIDALPAGAAAHVGGLSVSVAWRDLQPAAGGPIARPNAIDEALDAVRRAGPAAGCPRGVKVRVLAGSSAPAWAMALDGPPLAMTLPIDGLQGLVPRFWSPGFGAAYEGLQRALAQVYDGVPEVREVAMTRCTTFYGEPLLRQATVPSNAAALAQAGLDTATDRRCLQEQTAAHRVWERTPSTLALNPYVGVEPGQPAAGTVDLAVAVAQDCRRVLAERCVLANNSLRVPVPPGPYTELYEAMRGLGQPLEFQTAGPRRVGDLVGAVQYAVTAGAASVETEPASAVRHAEALAALAGASGWGPR